MSGKDAYNNYEDEIDLYGDAEAPAEEQRARENDQQYGEEKIYNDQQGGNREDNNNQDRYNNQTSSIPTFISEARGGTGVIPRRDETGGAGGDASGSTGNNGNGKEGDEGVLPRRGDYGSPGQWSTKPISTVRPSDMPEEGKMFIGGLNWETTEEKMRKYFEQFGEVTHCTIMHDPQTGRSRGFGFLTFREASAVNSVMVKEHYLDGKIIDPKRAIPRPEVGGVVRQDKLFVRQIPHSMDYPAFKEYFSQFGSITDSNLMIDRETGMHRGFGFVTYDDASGASNALSQAHYVDGQELEVKMATQKTRNQDTYVGDRPVRARGFQQNQGYGGQGGQGGGYQGSNNQGGGMSNMGNMGQMGQMGQMGNMGGMGGMGGMNPMAAMGNMGMGMGGGAGGNGGQQAFDPYAMSQFFKQMGWGNFNPMMLMQGAMMGGNQGNMMGGQGGIMPGMMDPSAMMGMMNAGMGNMGGGGMSPAGMGQMGNMGGGAGNFSPPGGNAGNAAGGSGSQSGEGSNFGDLSRQPPKGPRSQQMHNNSNRSPVDTRPPPDAPKGPRGAGGGGAGGGGPGPMRGGGRGAPRDHPYR